MEVAIASGEAKLQTHHVGVDLDCGRRTKIQTGAATDDTLPPDNSMPPSSEGFAAGVAAVVAAVAVGLETASVRGVALRTLRGNRMPTLNWSRSCESRRAILATWQSFCWRRRGAWVRPGSRSPMSATRCSFVATW